MKPRQPPSASPSESTFTLLRNLPIANQLGSYQSTMLYWGFYEPRYWRNYLHTHSFFEICYAYQGTGTFRTGGKLHRVKAGDLFIAPPAEEHEIISSRGKPLGIYYWAYTLTRSRPADVSHPVDALLEGFMRSPRRVVSGAGSIKPTLKLLSGEIANRPAGYPLVIEGLTAKLLIDTARAAVGPSFPAEEIERPARTEAEAAVATACRYIGDNLSRAISLRDVAAQVHLSERHLGRLFLQIKQMTVLDFITQMRMDAASHLLLSNHWPVKKIAAAVGYPNLRYFITLFRTRLKTTPANFRRNGGTVFAN